MSLVTFFNEFDQLFDEAFARRAGSGSNNQLQHQPGNTNNATRALRPKIDLHEDKDKNLVTATFELPGINKQDVNIEVRNNVLSISGESKFSSDRDEKGYLVRERRFGRFARSLPLPEGVKPEEIKASMDNGVLTVTFPRQTPEQLPRRISVA